MSAHAPHPNCMLQVDGLDDHARGPGAGRPSTSARRRPTRRPASTWTSGYGSYALKNFCTLYRVNDPSFYGADRVLEDARWRTAATAGARPASTTPSGRQAWTDDQGLTTRPDDRTAGSRAPRRIGLPRSTIRSPPSPAARATLTAPGGASWRPSTGIAPAQLLLLLAPPVGLVRRGLPRLARAPARVGVLVPRPAHLGDRARVQPGQLPAAPQRARVYRTIALRTVGDRRAGHRWRTSSWPSRSPTTWPASRRPAQRAVLFVARAAAALVELPRPGLRLAGHPGQRRAARLGRSGWSGCPTCSLGYLATSSMAIVFTYLWLPYMILPIFAGLERIPSSLLEASADLGGTVRDDVPPRRPAARRCRRSRRDRSSPSR